MSNNINILNRVNHLGNVSILQPLSPLLSLPSQATGYDGTGMQIVRCDCDLMLLSSVVLISSITD